MYIQDCTKVLIRLYTCTYLEQTAYIFTVRRLHTIIDMNEGCTHVFMRRLHTVIDKKKSVQKFIYVKKNKHNYNKKKTSKTIKQTLRKAYM